MTREEAIEIIRHIYDVCLSDELREAFPIVIEALEADRPRGEWKVRHPKPFFLCECSVCGESEEWMSKFCPNCGADMRGEDDEMR